MRFRCLYEKYIYKQLLLLMLIMHYHVLLIKKQIFFLFKQTIQAFKLQTFYEVTLIMKSTSMYIIRAIGLARNIKPPGSMGAMRAHFVIINRKPAEKIALVLVRYSIVLSLKAICRSVHQ